VKAERTKGDCTLKAAATVSTGSSTENKDPVISTFPETEENMLTDGQVRP